MIPLRTFAGWKKNVCPQFQEVLVVAYIFPQQVDEIGLGFLNDIVV
jgi:hypothetical protein